MPKKLAPPLSPEIGAPPLAARSLEIEAVRAAIACAARKEAFGEAEEQPLAHAQHVAWRLFISLHAVLIRRVERDLSAAGKISFLEYDALMCLYEAPARKLRITELAAAMVITTSGVSRLVDRLQARGLMERQPCENDGRSFLACLTPAGLAALKDAWKVYRQTIDRDFAAHVSDEGAREMSRTFRAILADIDPVHSAPLIHTDVVDEPSGEL